MAALVVEHVALGAETFTAVLWADKRPLVLVDPIVDFQILLLAKRLAAVRELALVGLRAVVHVLVGMQAHLAVEGFATAFVFADEN